MLDIIKDIENGKKPNAKKHADDVTKKVTAEKPEKVLEPKAEKKVEVKQEKLP